MTSRFAAGKVPDILIGKAQDVPVYQELGAILPIDSGACGGIDPDALVDEILLEIGHNQALAAEIMEFTTSNSTLTGQADTDSVRMLGDVERWRKEGAVANVAAGNAQFPWPFQTAVAEKVVQWLNGALDMDGLLEFMSKSSAK